MKRAGGKGRIVVEQRGRPFEPVRRGRLAPVQGIVIRSDKRQLIEHLLRRYESDVRVRAVRDLVP